MKKSVLVIGGVIVLAAVVASAVLMLRGGAKNTARRDQSESVASSGANSATFKVVQACKAFTLADATAVLGSGAKASANNGQSDTASNDVAVSTCSYSGAAGLTIQDTKTVTVLARSAKSAAAADSNKSVFGPSKPTGKQDIGGLADAAFWDATLSQLDILKGNNWYIIGNMSGTHADSGTLDVSKSVYNQIKNKL